MATWHRCHPLAIISTKQTQFDNDAAPTVLEIFLMTQPTVETVGYARSPRRGCNPSG